MPKVDAAALPEKSATGYPPPFAALVAGRRVKSLSAPLSDFTVNLCTIAPGSGSSQRHWHSDEDEFVYVLSGEATLVEDDGATLLRAGDAAVFPKGVANGHHLLNHGSADLVFLAIGPDRPDTDVVIYPDIGMRWSVASGYVVTDPNASDSA